MLFEFETLRLAVSVSRVLQSERRVAVAGFENGLAGGVDGPARIISHPET